MTWPRTSAHGADQRSRLLDFIKDYRTKHGISPSIREMRDALKLNSTATVHAHLVRLERDGLVRFRTETPRSVVPL